MAEEQAAPSLEDTISNAMEKQEAAFEKSQPEPDQAPSPSPAPEQPTEPEPAEAVKPEEERPGERDDKGRFKAKAAEKIEAEEPAEAKPEDTQEAVRPDISRPPKRLPPRLKHTWMSLPEIAREDIIARENEVEKSFEPYKGLGRYVQQANSNGTTLQAAVRDYAQLEDAFRQDPLRGAVYAWQRIGVPQNVINDWMGRIIQHNPEQQSQPQPQPGMTQEQIRALAREELESSRVMSTIEAFVRDPKHVHLQHEMLNADGTIDLGPEMGPLRDHMHRLLNARLANDLEDAYKQSCIRHGLDPAAPPNGSAAGGQVQRAAAAERSRQAAKATVGAPSSNTPRQQRSDNQADNRSLEQVVADAMARQEGRQ